MKQIVVFGNGMLGKYVLNYFKKSGYNVLQITRQDYDVLLNTKTDLYEIFKTFERNNYVIINTIGLIPHRGGQPLDYYTVNAYFPKMLDEVNDIFGGKYIHITTDCVFDGKRGNYIESDVKTETNLYGKSKALGENLENATIIRTSIIGEQLLITEKPSLLEWVRLNKNKVIEGYSRHYWNGVTCLKLSEIMEAIVRDNSYWRGVRHYYTNTVSKYELVKLINEIYDLNITINKNESGYIVNKTLSSSFSMKIQMESIRELIIKQKNFIFEFNKN